MPKSATEARIFTVDESIESLRSMATILHRENFRVRAFTDELRVLKAASYRVPDLLIAETSSFFGIRLATRLQARQRTCRVLFISESACAGPLEIARRNGLEFETIPKPVDPNELFVKVSEMTMSKSRSAAEDLVVKTYNDNVQETLLRLRGHLGVSKLSLNEKG
jgi:response regulator RpfG family c-di-GMP phosphodiesterase